ncbi:hypothetical protein E5676_scaffold194G00140 [Cucumis melo var. makuwa]|uniref:Uncharacterized protein n=1 Tax=Cucumis melo var. makuwa TaxID=1194695 RepID=A0A5A7UXT8_CUCMM|nr:hypothetical protein E6C27_scaffold340G00100 [Cucumis melo var. makuwa]TYJ97226.1 hypothetical protein E5676_scaffold194G00140 [Cucumis melo var. makuwa]
MHHHHLHQEGEKNPSPKPLPPPPLPSPPVVVIGSRPASPQPIPYVVRRAPAKRHHREVRRSPLSPSPIQPIVPSESTAIRDRNRPKQPREDRSAPHRHPTRASSRFAPACKPRRVHPQAAPARTRTSAFLHEPIPSQADACLQAEPILAFPAEPPNPFDPPSLFSVLCTYFGLHSPTGPPVWHGYRYDWSDSTGSLQPNCLSVSSVFATDQYVLGAPSGHRRPDYVPTGAHVARVRERASYWVEAGVRARQAGGRPEVTVASHRDFCFRSTPRFNF